MSSTAHEDAFLDEVLGLFVLEAQEWINQSNTALLELEHHPESDRKQKLYETIVCGITNLGGSAATVELRDLEKLAFGLLPLLHTLRSLNGSTTAVQLGALREGFNGIIAAVQALGDTKTGRVANLDQILLHVSQAVQQTAAGQHSSPDKTSVNPPPPAPPPSVIELLSEFQRRHATTSDPTRHTIDAIVRKAKRDYGERGWRTIDASTVRQILQELDGSDEQLLNEVHTRLPTIGGIFADLTSPHADMLLSNGRMDKLLQEVQALHDAARTFDAKPIMQFFHGLHGFLTILSQKAVEIVRSRVEAVESRIKRTVSIAEQWAEVGKKERAVIQQLIQR